MCDEPMDEPGQLLQGTVYYRFFNTVYALIMSTIVGLVAMDF